MTSRVEFPGMRYDLIGQIKKLSDLEMQKEKWTNSQSKHSFSDNLRFPVDGLLEEGNLDEELYATAKIGYWFRDADEASVAHELAKSLMCVIKKIGMDKPDSTYINSPLWQDVVQKAKIAYDVLMEDESIEELLKQEAARKVS